MIAKFKLDKDMIYLIETLKVEGYWSKKHFTLTLQNKDMELLNNIERIVRNLGINISKRLLLKVRAEDNAKKEQIRLIYHNKDLNFHIERSPFNPLKVKAVTSLPFKKRYEIIYFDKDNKIPIKIGCSRKAIEIESKVNCWAYKDIRFPTKDLLNFLEEYCGNKKEFRVEDFLFNADKELVISALSALIDCEGTITWYGLKREIQIRMKSKEYLMQWRELLSKFNIGCRFEKSSKGLWGIAISGWEDFNRLENLGLSLKHSKKSKRLKEMMLGFKRNQISRGSFKEFYIQKLKEMGKEVTSRELSQLIQKNVRTTSHFLLKLEKLGKVVSNKEVWPYKYSISK